MHTETLLNKTHSNYSKEIILEIAIKAIKHLVQEKLVIIGIRTNTDKTIDRGIVTTTRTTVDNTLLALDLRTINRSQSHKDMSIEVGSIAEDPANLDPRTIGIYKETKRIPIKVS